MTAGMSSVTEAVSHLPRACGSRGLPFPFGFDAACAFFFRLFCAGVLMMSSGVRGTGAAS